MLPRAAAVKAAAKRLGATAPKALAKAAAALGVPVKALGGVFAAWKAKPAAPTLASSVEKLHIFK